MRSSVEPTYIKATTRDIKNYQRAQGLRRVPIGYSAADIQDNRMQQAHYFNCGQDNTRSDFFAFNDYSWCNTDFETADWDEKVANFTDYGVPIFLSEFGCRTNGERVFGEIESLMHSNMTSVYSGGLMYEYSLESNEYGIAELDGSSVRETNEFENLVSAFSRWPAPTGDGSPEHTTTHSNECPTPDSVWEVRGSNLPAMPEGAEDYMENGVGRGPGLDGPGSQHSNSSTSTGTIESDEPSPSGSMRPRPSSDSDEEDEDDDNAAHSVNFEKGALLLTGATVLFTLFGTLML